jgi:hypothetical protein
MILRKRLGGLEPRHLIYLAFLAVGRRSICRPRRLVLFLPVLRQVMPIPGRVQLSQSCSPNANSIRELIRISAFRQLCAARRAVDGVCPLAAPTAKAVTGFRA